MSICLKFPLLLLAACLSLPVGAQDELESDLTGRSFNDKTTGTSSDNNPADNEKSSANPNQIDTLRIRYCRIGDYLGEKTEAFPDTIPLDFQNNAFPERLNTIAAAHTGSFGSPFQSKIYSDQTAFSPFLFMRSYENWLIAPDKFTFLNTTKPYSNLKYLTTAGNDESQEEDFSFYFSANTNKYLNIGASYELLYARGFYEQSSTRSKLANAFGNYQSPRYEAFWKASYNYLENMENGGITDDRYITDPLQMSGGYSEYESLNIPVWLSDDRSRLKNHQLFFNHKYHIGFERADQTDSLKKTFVPVTSIIHTLFIDRSQRSYLSESVNLTYYDSVANIDDSYTADTAALFHIRNTVGLSLREGFHSWAKMGLTAFLEHDYRKYTGLSPSAALRDTANAYSRLKIHHENLLWIGAELSKRQGTVLTYSAFAKMCMLGEDVGDFELSGQLRTSFSLWNHPVKLTADGYIKNLHPDYFMDYYYSNHFSWNNDFRNEYKTRVNGSLDIPALGFSFSASLENLTNHLYFNDEAVPEQYSGNIQVLSANWKQHLGLGILNWDNNLVYQASSYPTILPLPTLAVYSNLYLKGMVSKVMTTQVGVDCKYHTSYYAPAYMPATGQFYTQQSVLVGNYPYMNVYANFHLKRMRFFVMYSHVSRLFADPQYFSSPHYPLNPAILKAGLSWNFYD